MDPKTEKPMLKKQLSELHEAMRYMPVVLDAVMKGDPQGDAMSFFAVILQKTVEAGYEAGWEEN